MLIICSGPDSFRARQKARELADAFRAKHDPSGFSVDILREPNVTELVQHLGAPSFFSTKRFIRVDGLFAKIKIADVRLLAKRLAADKDQTIVVTVEEEEPPAKTLSEFTDSQVFKYSHPRLSGKMFLDWCVQRATELGASKTAAELVARSVDGDAWLAEQELIKLSANPAAPLAENIDEAGSVFEAIDAYLGQRSTWRSTIAESDTDQLLVMALSQARSLVRIMDHEMTGIHPYVAKKYARFNAPKIEQRFLTLIKTMVATRIGVGQSAEIDILL